MAILQRGSRFNDGKLIASQEYVDEHGNKKDNPHSVTKSQVGLGSVENYGTATKAEAENGSANNKYITPLRAKEAISKLETIGVSLVLDNQVVEYNLLGTNPSPSITQLQANVYGNSEADTDLFFQFFSRLGQATAWTSIGGPSSYRTANISIPTNINQLPLRYKVEVRRGSASGAIIATDYVELVGKTSQAIAGSNVSISGNTISTTDTKYNNATTSVSGLMSNTDKSKLDGIATEANNYTHPSTHPASMITETSTKRFTTDAEKANWNSKTDDTAVDSHVAKTDNPHNVTKAQVGLSNVDNTDDLSKPVSTATQDALDLKADKSQVLTNVPVNAKFTDTVYTHPSSHPASIIVETSTQRFVTDAEKSTWNAKQDTIVAGTNLTKSGNTLNAIDTKYNNATTLVSGLMSDIDKTKLDGVASGANNYEHPSSHPASIITETTSKRFVTDAEKAIWNAKQNALVAGSNVTISGNTISATNTNTTYDVATTTTNGLMAAVDKVKLNGIATGANNYTHPSSHPASIITETSTQRFVTDDEKANWNSKTDDTVVNTHIAQKDNPHAVTKAQVGLSNVSNTAQASKTEFDLHNSDTTKHVTASERTAWNSKQNNLGFTPENVSNKSKANGYASLDANGKVPASELPSYVDDVIEATTLATLPTTGETGKIYVTTDDNKTYRWSGTAYAEISASLALGTTSSTAYRGDLGNTAYSHSQATGNPHGTTKAQIGLGNVDNTSDASKPVSTAMQTELDKKANSSQVLTNVPASAKFTDTIYSHPSTHPASMITESTTKRFVTDAEKAIWDAKQNELVAGSNVTISGNTISATNTNTTYGVVTTTVNGLMEATDKVKLNGIAANANNYSHPATHPASMITESSSQRFVSDSEKSTWNTKADTSVASSLANGLMASSDKSKLDGIENGANNYVLPDVLPSGMIAQTSTNRFVSDTEKATWNSKQNALTAGSNVSISGSTISAVNTTYSVATASSNGLMASGDKSKLDGIAAGANNYTHPSTHPYSMITGTPTSLPANGGSATSANHLIGDDTRSVNSNPSVYMSGGSRYEGRAGWQTEFKYVATLGAQSVMSGSYCYLQTHTPWSDSSGGYPVQVIYGADSPSWRVGVSTTAWSAWTKFADGGNASTVNGKTVLSDVPSSAKFTDTVYSHPSSHPASMITETSTQRFVTDDEKSTWNAKADTSLAGSGIDGLMLGVDKSKLDGIAKYANNYVHPETHPASMITEMYLKRFVSDAEKIAWNAKADTSAATTSANGLMSSTDKTKLNGIATGANNYTHPSTHPPTIIAQTSTGRFVTDTEKSTWNAKADTSVATISANGLMSYGDKVKLNVIPFDAQANPSIASQVEALTGTNDTNMMTPLRTKEAILESTIVVVNHGTNSYTARPAGAVAVYWIGTVAPFYAYDNDLWIGG